MFLDLLPHFLVHRVLNTFKNIFRTKINFDSFIFKYYFIRFEILSNNKSLICKNKVGNQGKVQLEIKIKEHRS